jgi:nicotinate-nucleotide pyrophosphorylase (carboxylating)
MTPAAAIDDILTRAFDEDAPWGDLTSDAFVPHGARARAALVARQPGVASGLTVFARAFALLDQDAAIALHAADGELFLAGSTLATVDGDARAVLRAERVALNLVQRLSGLATMTAHYVAQVADTQARVIDTRKTTPGLRILERAAVRDGGGHNHRYSLSDAILAKDNHLAVLAAAGVSVGDAIRAARARIPHTATIEVEVDRLDQIEEVVAAGVDTIMLDNFTPDELRAGVALVAGRARIEASGGITLETIREIALTGVDVISVGALTHSVKSLDLGLDISVIEQAP